MGYRSQVTLAIKKDFYDDLIVLNHKLPDLIIGSTIINKPDVVIFNWDDIKWYESYPEISEVINFMEFMDNHSELNNIPPLYGFMRMGEEYADFDSLGEPYEYGLDYTREITY